MMVSRLLRVAVFESCVRRFVVEELRIVERRIRVERTDGFFQFGLKDEALERRNLQSAEQPPPFSNEQNPGFGRVRVGPGFREFLGVVCDVADVFERHPTNGDAEKGDEQPVVRNTVADQRNQHEHRDNEDDESAYDLDNHTT